MGFKSDIEIAQETVMSPITEIAAKAGIDPKYLEQYGNYKAKIDYTLLKETDNLWIPMKRFLNKQKKSKWGDWDGLYLEDEEFV